MGGSIVIDPFSVFFNGLFVVSTVLAITISVRYLENEESTAVNITPCCSLRRRAWPSWRRAWNSSRCLSAWELMALCFYVMVGFLRNEKRSNEAAIKYLILGAFSSGLLAYGFSILTA